jgi:hypothetical protein
MNKISVIPIYIQNIKVTPPSFMKFRPVVPEICRGQVHVPRKKRKKDEEEEEEENNNNKKKRIDIYF